MSLTNLRIGNRQPELPSPVNCGPREFATFICDEYVREKDFWSQVAAPMSSIVFPARRETIQSLLEIAYFASLKTEEGEFAKPNIVLSKQGVQPEPHRPIVHFEQPLPLTIDTLAKIGPSLASECALWVRFDESVPEHLVCCGILDCRVFPRPSFGGSLLEADMSNAVFNSHAHLAIRTLAPGAMEARFAFRRFSLKAGKIRAFAAYSRVPGVRRLFEDSSKSISEFAEMQLGKKHATNHWMAVLR